MGLMDKMKNLVSKRGGADALKEDAGELKDVASGSGSPTDKAKDAADAVKDPGAPGEEGSAQVAQRLDVRKHETGESRRVGLADRETSHDRRHGDCGKVARVVFGRRPVECVLIARRGDEERSRSGCCTLARFFSPPPPTSSA